MISKLYQDLFEMYVEDVMKEYEARGLAIAAVDVDGMVQYEHFRGYADQEEHRPIDENTIFGLASVTKSFTALAVMQLAEQGILDLDDPVSNYIPEYKNHNQKTVRICHLLTHSAGFCPEKRILIRDVAEKLGVSERNGDCAYDDRIAQAGIEMLAARLDNRKERLGEPGQYLSYSNDSYGLLTDIIRRKGGCGSYSGYITEHIIRPLRMDRSCPDFIRPGEDKNTAVLYRKRDGLWIADKDFYDDAFVLMGGGGMKSTIADMKRYLTMYLNKGKLGDIRVAAQAGINRMCTPRAWYRPQEMYGYGLSCGFQDDLTVWGHGGSLPGVSSHIAWSYELEMGIVVLCNTSGVPVASVSSSLMKLLNGKNPLIDRDLYREHGWSKQDIKQACGRFVSDEGTEIEFFEKKEGGIGLTVDGRAQNPILVQPELVIIRNKLADTMLRLFKDEEQRVWAVGYSGRMIMRS